LDATVPSHLGYYLSLQQQWGINSVRNGALNLVTRSHGYGCGENVGVDRQLSEEELMGPCCPNKQLLATPFFNLLAHYLIVNVFD
jgi:hypothetical protein